MALVPIRQQFIYDLSGVKSKSFSDILQYRRQWETFERVENYDDIIFQRLSDGYRDKLYYQFTSRQEANDYYLGQAAHIRRYPSEASNGLFTSIRDRPMPNVPIKASVPNYGQVSNGLSMSSSISAGDNTLQLADMTTYLNVSTYNSSHVYKYIFTSDLEKMAYHRAERVLRQASN